MTMEAGALAIGGLEWLLGQSRTVGAALVWPATPDSDELDPCLYSGGAGIVLALLEGHRHTGDDRYAVAALRGCRGLLTLVDEVRSERDGCSLSFGLTGMAVALHATGDLLGDTEATAASRNLLGLVRQGFDGERWGDLFDLLGGNAGIALGALATGDRELALLAVLPYVERAEPTVAGVHWEVRRGLVARFHHISHGTLGIVLALAAVGAATGRTDLVELAEAGAADVASRDEAGPDGFLVPHSDPQHRPDLIERHSYGWCHGPTGDAQVFRRLGAATGDPRYAALEQRCWQTVTTSGLPARRRPGFWDNSGRCCGTAGVLALALDRCVERAADLGFVEVLVADLAARATVDATGARWSNHEHRVVPSSLAPRTGWAMGNAGIVRELLRYERLRTGADPGYAVDWPDHPPARPARPR